MALNSKTQAMATEFKIAQTMDLYRLQWRGHMISIDLFVSYSFCKCVIPNREKTSWKKPLPLFAEIDWFSSDCVVQCLAWIQCVKLGCFGPNKILDFCFLKQMETNKKLVILIKKWNE